ncbi:MAG: hypothetical protein HC915_16435, partial [Anaerolineae bacterium]|nr:hypothetical protein [Anaerolineae bacterium]
RLSQLQAAPGEQIEVWLEWRKRSSGGLDYAVYLHLVDADGVTLRGQMDGTPEHLGRVLPTNFWGVDTPIYDHHRLPIFADAPPGRYALRLGWYERQTFARLSVTPGMGNRRRMGW